MTEKYKKVTIEQIEQALISNGGWFTKAAKALGVSHQAISKRVAKSERLQRTVEEVKAKYLDLAESKLLQKINNGDLGAICFYLKCQGKDRGYIERQQVDNTSSDGSMTPQQTIDASKLSDQALQELMDARNGNKNK